MYENTPELIERAKSGDRRAREEVITGNMGLIHSVVKKFLNRGYDADDLFQVGCIGIIKAMDKFDFSFNVRFSTYAVPMIIGEIKRFLRDDGMIKVSRSLKEVSAKAYAVKEKMENELGRAVSIAEIADRMKEPVESVVMAMEATASPDSIYRTVGETEKNDVYLLDRLADKSGNEDKLIDNLALKQLINQLCDRDKKIIILRYFKGRTQREISCELGISQVQISRIEKKIIGQLRTKLKGA